MKKLVFLSMPIVLLSSCTTKEEKKSPNVVFIVTDDQGYGDLSCNGNPFIDTPNLDNLNSQSVTFSDFHTSTVSAPTRAGLMSGKYCNATGVWHTVSGRSLLTLDLPTMPQLFNEAGYATGMFGKWHLGDNYPYRPHDRGFDEAFYHKGGGVGQTPDYWGNNYMDDVYFRNGMAEKVQGYCTDVWFREAISFIEKNKDNHFFCYIAPNAPHTPLNVETKYYNMYKNKPGIANPAYYGMITNIDENIGKLMDYLEKNSLLENTIVVFMSDNGTYKGAIFDKQGFVKKGYNAGMRGEKATPYEGGHRVPFMIRIPGQEHKTINSLASYIDILPTFMDLCGLENKIPADIDGESFMKLIDGNDESERYLFADNQSREFLVKGKSSCVMYKRWRLVNGTELYNLEYDPEQKVNVAEQYPDIVRRMTGQYEEWWIKCTVRSDKYEPIVLGTPDSENIALNCHDIHNDSSQIGAWNQTKVRSAVKSVGYWVLDVKKKGKYKVSLYRWAPESGIKINNPAPEKIETWGNASSYKEGVVLKDLSEMEIFVNHKSVVKENIDTNQTNTSAVIELNEGLCFLQTDFILGKPDKRTSAYYVTVELQNRTY